ncbi:MAG: peptide chain release factor N(5)-glutamine methyltransferase [Deltaproteobacteria bacterium]|nr:peptide chain release factor N(5)-glutamine methyltransferase [Deltaproteobacteria bacterium]
MREAKARTIIDLLKVASGYLKQRDVKSPRLNAEVLLAHLLGLTRIQLYLQFDRLLNEDELSGYRALIKRRLNREPLQYITGTQEFWSLDLSIGPSVLVPRPESELLVEKSLSLLGHGMIPHAEQPRILDLCTGSGALAVALATEIRNGSFWASDISSEAITFARSNACRHGVERRIQFLTGDLWKPVQEQGVVFDLIVSNPPYIPSDALQTLSPEVGHEPQSALDGGEDGMFYIRGILADGARYLYPGGWILVEMDPDQTLKALELMEQTGEYGSKERVKDYSRLYRVVMARKQVDAGD